MRIGTLLHERILKVPCKKRELSPADPEEIAVENTLFGWILHLHREQVPCESESVARYLAAFARMGFIEVPVPKDHRIVEEVVEDLERGVEDLTKQIEEEISGELNPSRRKQLFDLVWEGVRERLETEGALALAR